MSRFPKSEQVLNEAIAGGHFPCAAYGVLAKGEVKAVGALGHFTDEPTSPLLEPQMAFDLASVTKVVATTAMAMLLHQRGKLDLSLPLGEVLPGFVVGRDHEDSRRARRVTLAHLLAHTSGLPGYVELFPRATNPTAVLRGCLELKLEAEPGTRAEYSDHGFILLGKALEILANESLDQFISREIFSPLGMTATRFNPRLADRSFIPPTELDRKMRFRVIQGEVEDEHAFLMKGVAGHAGLFSNVSDLLKFAAAILEARPAVEKASLFHAETVELFAQRQAPEGSSRALGWDTPSENSSSGKHFSVNSIGHLGFSGTSLWIDREAQVAVALLTNRTWPDRTQQGIKLVRPAFHDAVREEMKNTH